MEGNFPKTKRSQVPYNCSVKYTIIAIYANISGHVYFVDCTHDAHCQNCPVGVTGECIYSHSSHQLHCNCPGKIMIKITEIKAPILKFKDFLQFLMH